MGKLFRYLLAGCIGATLGWLVSEPWTQQHGYGRDLFILYAVSLGLVLGLVFEKFIYHRKFSFIPKTLKKFWIFIIPLAGALLLKQILVLGATSDGVVTEQASADIVFMIDTSGSMTSELEGIKSSCVEFAEEAGSRGIQSRIGLVDFDWDGSGDHNYEFFSLKEDPYEFQSSIQSLHIGRLGGGGAYVGDPTTLAVFQAIPSIYDDPARSKILVLISDEVGEDIVTDQIIEIMQSHNITVNVVGVDGVNAHTRLAASTDGQFWDIRETRGIDFSSLMVDDIAVEIASGLMEVSQDNDNKANLPWWVRVLGWSSLGLITGLTIGLAEWSTSSRRNRDMMLVGIAGGILGGALSGLIFGFIATMEFVNAPMVRLTSFIILGCVMGASLFLVSTLYTTVAGQRRKSDNMKEMLSNL